MVLVSVVPVVAGVLYVSLGNPAALNPTAAPATSAAAAPHGSGDVTDPQIVAMIDRLAEKMKANPDDPKGWFLLGRSYFKMGRYDEAVAALAEASKRVPENATLLADQAEAIAMTQGQKLAGRPAELLKRALELDPNDPKTIAMSGAVASERGDADTAIKLYQRLKALVPPNSEESQQIDQVIAELQESRKGAPAVAAAPPAAPAAAPAKAIAAPPASVAASGAAGAGVSGRVEIDPKLAARMAPGDTLFIYARNAEGSRMPLAILRGTAGELPKAFALTDAMAMMPAQTIRSPNPSSWKPEFPGGQRGGASRRPRGASAPIAPGRPTCASSSTRSFPDSVGVYMTDL